MRRPEMWRVVQIISDRFVWHHRGRAITFTWMGDIDVPVTRVYALAFTPERKMLLVSGGPDGSGYWLPGGGVEDGETPELALVRELGEEAAAAVHEVERLGVQRVDDSEGTSEYQAIYWCRVRLAESFVPQFEVAERKVVAPEDFLDTLFWGREDPKAAMLLKRALQLESERSAAIRRVDASVWTRCLCGRCRR